MSETSKGVLVKLHCAVITQDGPIQVPVAFFYTKDAPFQVTFIADENTETGTHVEWNYSRELLFDALNGTPETLHGEGNVTTFMENNFVYTLLQQEDRGCLIAFHPSDIATFLTATEEIVPMGQESMDFDAELEELFNGE